MISGHWTPRWIDDAYLDHITEGGEDIIRLHNALLPLDDMDLGADGVVARIAPYYSKARVGDDVIFTVAVRNPFRERRTAAVRIVAPVGWRVKSDVVELELPPSGWGEVEVQAVVGGAPVPRGRLAVDVMVGERHLGQQAEALVDVTAAG